MMTASIPSVATEMTSEIALDRLRETDQIEIGMAN
jgi:hypothetical protein